MSLASGRFHGFVASVRLGAAATSRSSSEIAEGVFLKDVATLPSGCSHPVQLGLHVLTLASEAMQDSTYTLPC